ncbi:hypothetical protein J7L06_08315 [Candidatus Bathyarchaeota archaeon]|nr:hypothetical protein [Candidatus Bathyarchaeota archaeon]
MRKCREVDKKPELEEACRELRERGLPEERLKTMLSDEDRFLRALEAVKKGKVKKYVFKPSGKVIWIVVGKKREYIVLPKVSFCSCDDYYYRIMNEEISLCYHLIACWIAEATGKFDLIEEEDSLYDFLLGDWKKQTS